MATSVLAQLDNVENRLDSDDDVVMKQSTSKAGLVMESSDEESEDESIESDEENEKSLTLEEAMKRKTITPSSSKKDKRQQFQRRRRRSSARFLRLSGRFDTADDDDETEEISQNTEQLGEMYRRAIRMNAENRINAGNSWGLNLIDNIDKFLVDDEDRRSSPTNARAPVASANSSSGTQERRVNFTKASCTLDASVKIYSYRVDDVHLSSYKVLANLNRTDNNKSSSQEKESPSQDTQDDSNNETAATSRSTKSTAETLETNLANINMNKLDSAFDIDPLFHKMSKTFDEGGAKGLLLVNLGVGSDGCGIVFDSKEEEAGEESTEEDTSPEDDERCRSEEGMVDISSLVCKLKSMLGDSTIESFSLVPQLKSLREEQEMLEADGYVDDSALKTKSQRYATPRKEEREAEKSILKDMGGSTSVPLGGRTLFAEDEEADTQYAADDFGGGDDDYDDDDDDIAFNDFVASDENAARYSGVSFQGEDFVTGDDTPSGAFNSGPSNTTVLLDALASGEAISQGGDYEYFNKSAIDKITGGNMWAGSAHWKKTKTARDKTNQPTKKQSRKKKTNKKEKQALVKLSAPSDEVMKDVLKKPAVKKSKRGAATDPLAFPKATKTKHSKVDNLLPLDAGIGIEQLSKLFLRPSATVVSGEDSREKHTKTVGFCDNTTFGFDDGDDDSYGDDDDGPGFAFADDGGFGENDDNDDFVIGELEGIRKVDKVQVGFATVAKKVDVKRLKKDLWNEIETVIIPPSKDDKEDNEDKDDASTVDEEDKASVTEGENPASAKFLSFKETVQELESSQSQSDVSLPFYFICLLHLANEKGLRLDSTSLDDFAIYHDSEA